MPVKNKLSDEEIKNIQDLKAHGYNIPQIQEATIDSDRPSGYSTSTIDKYIKEAKLVKVKMAIPKPGLVGMRKTKPELFCVRPTIRVIDASDSIPTKVKIWDRVYVLVEEG